MNTRQRIAFNEPLLSLFQITANTVYREDRLLPSGIFFSTYLTVHAFEHPFSWHASAGFVRSISEQGNAPGVAIRVAEWDDEMKVLAMNECSFLLRGIGRSDGGQHWDKAEIGALSFQAWRRCSADEYQQIVSRRADVAPVSTLFPVEWESKRRIINLEH
ncbi:MAG: hypothetical protein AB7U82_27895 [Blastocatellales bacterium]